MRSLKKKNEKSNENVIEQQTQQINSIQEEEK